jgi:hypothetical protein
LTSRFAVGRLSHAATPPVVAPLRVTGIAEKEGERIKFSASGFDISGTRRLGLEGHMTLAEMTGEAEVEIPTVSFAPDGLQPRALLPRATTLNQARGSGSASVRLSWDASGVVAAGEVALENFSFVTPDASVEGLTTRIEFDRLLPLSTPKGQLLTAKSVDPAIPIENIQLRFQIDPEDSVGGMGRVRVERADAVFLGGHIAISDTVIAPDSSIRRVTLETADLPLGRLLRLIDVKGLEGTGLLSGQLPITITDNAVLIKNGQLQTSDGGVIRYRSDQAAKALAGAGEQVDLMLSALQDFHYDALSLTLDKDESGVTRLLLRMRGHNPAVLEGHPFQFNINLTGNLDETLAAVLAGYRASSRLLRRALELGQ